MLKRRAQSASTQSREWLRLLATPRRLISLLAKVQKIASCLPAFRYLPLLIQISACFIDILPYSCFFYFFCSFLSKRRRSCEQRWQVSRNVSYLIAIYSTYGWRIKEKEHRERTQKCVSKQGFGSPPEPHWFLRLWLWNCGEMFNTSLKKIVNPYVFSLVSAKAVAYDFASFPSLPNHPVSPCALWMREAESVWNRPHPWR